jgi:hypothetical protein
MRDVALMLGLGLMLNAPLSQGAEDPNWAQIQYQEAQQTEDPVARRLLLEHLLSALSEDSLLWLRVKGQLFVIEQFEGES